MPGMKIIRDILDWWVSHDTSFSQILIGFLIALVGLVITYYFGRSTNFHCVRTGADQARCEITHKLLGVQPMDVRRVDGIQQAELDENLDSSGDSTYRVILVTSFGSEPLTSSFSSGKSPKADLVERLNTFISSSQQETLDYQAKIEWGLWVFLIGFIGLGVGMIGVSLKKFIT
jgi:hypothetical protein